jgi:hypothetical protein
LVAGNCDASRPVSVSSALCASVMVVPSDSRATASMKCAWRLCWVMSHRSRCQTSTSSGKWNLGGITPATM